MRKEFLLSMSMISSAFTGVDAYAQNTEIVSPTNNTNSVISATVSTKQHNSKLTGDVSFTDNSLVKDIGNTIGNRYFGDFNLRFSSRVEGEMNKTFSLKSRINDQEQLMFSIPEANIEYIFGHSKLAFGRKILSWNMLDANWGMGKLNNRVNFTGFDPKQEGLTGLLFDHYNKKSGFKMSLFGSIIMFQN